MVCLTHDYHQLARCPCLQVSSYKASYVVCIGLSSGHPVDFEIRQSIHYLFSLLRPNGMTSTAPTYSAMETYKPIAHSGAGGSGQTPIIAAKKFAVRAVRIYITSENCSLRLLGKGRSTCSVDSERHQASTNIFKKLVPDRLLDRGIVDTIQGGHHNRDYIRYGY